MLLLLKKIKDGKKNMECAIYLLDNDIERFYDYLSKLRSLEIRFKNLLNKDLQYDVCSFIDGLLEFEHDLLFKNLTLFFESNNVHVIGYTNIFECSLFELIHYFNIFKRKIINNNKK